MQPTRVGIREFRENLSSYLESKTPVAITRHGATIGIYLPTKPKPSQAAPANKIPDATDTLDPFRKP